jgi:hypothetical protein
VKFFAKRVHVLWIGGEMHEDERQRCRSCFASCTNDKTRLAIKSA